MGGRSREPAGRAGLRGRGSECALLDELVAAIRRGESQSLVLRGEAGIGKTALLEYLIASAPDATIVRAVGVQSDMELPYAALHQLCGPLLDRLEALPPPQRRAMEIVFGVTAGEAPDRFLVGLAVLSLFSEAAEQRPLLCVVDDAQWLDQASALSSAVRFQLDERVRDRIIAETRGNPLALLELPRGLTARQLAGGFGLLGAQALTGRIEEASSGDSRRCPTTRGVCCWSRRPSRLAIRCCCGARPSGSGSGRRPRKRPRPTVCWRSASGCGSAIRWCARLSTGQRPVSNAGRSIWRWQRRLTAASTPTVARGIWPQPQRGPTSRLPRRSRSPPAARRRGADWPRQPRFFIAPSFCPPIPSSGCGVHLPPPKRAWTPASSRARSSFWRWWRPRRQTSCRRRMRSWLGVRSRSLRAWALLHPRCS